MPNYKEENVNGSKWTRCNRIEISNPYEQGSSKTITFHEQQLVLIANNEIIYKNIYGSGPGSLTTVYDSNGSIQIINPYTLESTGNTFTHQDLYLMLFSAYMDAAIKRDLNNT